MLQADARGERGLVLVNVVLMLLTAMVVVAVLAWQRARYAVRCIAATGEVSKGDSKGCSSAP